MRLFRINPYQSLLYGWELPVRLKPVPSLGVALTNPPGGFAHRIVEQLKKAYPWTSQRLKIWPNRVALVAR